MKTPSNPAAKKAATKSLKEKRAEKRAKHDDEPKAHKR
ncbi:hypothetical protein JOE65_002898 [Arthrobacter roseus]|nr:hypothetical protein [Arthrobacter roseus]